MRALYLTYKFDCGKDINLPVKELPVPVPKNNECLIKVISSGVNPSDVGGTLGFFLDAKLPRIPGRDYSGIVVQGDESLLGKRVWGSGGGAGITFDGTQAEFTVVPSVSIAEIPNSMDLLTAGAQTLPYIAAYYSLIERARIQAGETVLVLGAVGQVGRAAMSICEWVGCKAIALVLGHEELELSKKAGWNALDTRSTHLTQQIMALNNGKPVNVILNSVGNILWTQYMHVISKFGRIVNIAAREGMREVTLNLFELYRSNVDIIGVNTVHLSFEDNAKILNKLKPGFEAGKLQPLKIEDNAIFPLEKATEAYELVMSGLSRDRVVLSIGDEK